MSEWINESKQKPSYSGYFLVTYVDHTKCITLMFYDKNGDRWGTTHKCAVTHWQPLPDLPKE